MARGLQLRRATGGGPAINDSDRSQEVRYRMGAKAKASVLVLLFVFFAFFWLGATHDAPGLVKKTDVRHSQESAKQARLASGEAETIPLPE
jgi:hypothetical protein